MNKTDECIICFDLPLKDQDILSCGHRIHISCVQKQFKAECPLCRASLDIKVFGKKPQPDPFLFSPQPEDDSEIRQGIFVFRSGILGDVVERNFEEKEDNEPGNICHDDTGEEDQNEPWRSKGYLYAEEDSDYDEENPCGDSWEYEDV